MWCAPVRVGKSEGEEVEVVEEEEEEEEEEAPGCTRRVHPCGRKERAHLSENLKLNW